MSKNYNSNLQTNNTNLQAILEAINTLPEAEEQAAPVITVNTNGLITAIAGTKSTTKQLTTQAATTITPSTLDQIAINSGVYATGNITVKGDSNLVAENIVSGKSIFGVTGTASSGGGNTDVEDGLITRNITSYSNDRVTSIGDYAFYFFSSKLTTVSFPVCTTIKAYAFAYCSSLTTANFPNCTNIGSNAFTYCSRLTTVNFPVCTSIYLQAFSQCRSLTTVSLPKCINISASAFCRCFKLSSLTLGASTICTLSNSNAFSSTPFAGYKSYFSGTPVIYVPASLLASYKTATNWTYFSKYMQAISSGGGPSIFS